MAPAAAARAVDLRTATAADVEFVFATERLPGYEWLTARWTREEHLAALARADTRYLVGGWAGEPLQGFSILQPLADPHEGAKLKRICVTQPGEGFGGPFLEATIRWVFTATANDRLWLDVFCHNERARRAYRRAGMREDGLLRQAYRMPDGSRADRMIMSILSSEWRAA
ncbi:MAG TPA: GNAT family protein [Steroidobacteraceae bacterium]|nr:GNAT family protein [Steroidobacteraceae bacterium]